MLSSHHNGLHIHEDEEIVRNLVNWVGQYGTANFDVTSPILVKMVAFVGSSCLYRVLMF